jgi:hypothetical protein
VLAGWRSLFHKKVASACLSFGLVLFIGACRRWLLRNDVEFVFLKQDESLTLL